MAHTPDPFRFCVTCGQRVDPPAEELAAEMLAALKDMAAGWRYIRKHHGDLPGVGWDRAQFAAEAAILKAEGG